MPRIFADKHAHPPNRRVEGADRLAALHEALLVEQAVRRQKYLAMNVMNDRLGAPERHVQRAVIELVLPDLVEAHRHVERRAWSGLRVDARQISRDLTGGLRLFADAPFEEVSGKRGLRQLEQLRAGRLTVEPREELAQSLEVVGVRALPWLQLGYSEVYGARHE